MPFWSGKKLEAKIDEILQGYGDAPVDCAAYELRVGPEKFVTPNADVINPASVTIEPLSENESFAIPSGQFAFLLTEEIVTIPKDAVGFISMKASIKFRGLINISGFHVDPGFKGRLIYSVFNAGPKTIHLKRGKPAFLLWIADLSSEFDEKYIKTTGGYRDIPTDMINEIPGRIYSLHDLSDKITKTETTLRDRIHVVEKSLIAFSITASLFLVLMIYMVREPILENFRTWFGGAENSAQVASQSAATLPHSDKTNQDSQTAVSAAEGAEGSVGDSTSSGSNIDKRDALGDQADDKSENP